MESTTTTFENCAIYKATEMMGNIVRLDVRSVTIKTGEKYAQYNNAVKVEFVKKGARTRRGFYMTYKPFLVVLRAKDAISPDSIYSEPDAMGTCVGRYDCFESGWKSDFLSALAARGIQPIFQIDEDFNPCDFTKIAS